ncbi:MAG: hypothetical protein JWN76_3414 [Chitinophagaceae bacterium]|nr:hypothetical protein [Chitinophagaceae bacterium]
MRKLLATIWVPFILTSVKSQLNIPVRTLPNEVFRTIKKDPTDTTVWSWKRGGITSLTINQGNQSNWAAGGDNFSLAIGAYLNYYVLHKINRHSWDNSIDFNFGFLQTTSLGSRKNDDRIDILSKYGYNFDKKWYLSGLFNFRSQFFDGRSYSGTESSLSSTFLSPAYALLSAGFDYKPNNHLSVFFSPFTSRVIIIASDKLAAKGLYGVPEGKHSTNQLGAFGSVNFNQDFSKNISYRARADIFTNYKSNPQNIDLYMTNLISFRINKFLSATYNLDLIYDDDVKLFGDNKDSPALQVKSLIGIGFMMRLNQIAN